MGIFVAGEFSIDPFDRAVDGDPIGQMVGVGSVTGNASGGVAQVSFTLPQNFAYVVLAMGFTSTLGATAVHLYRLVTGLRVNGLDERYGSSIEALSVAGTEESQFIPPKMISLPGPVVPTMFLSIANVLGDTSVVDFRALVFDRHTVIAVPSGIWRDWIT